MLEPSLQIALRILLVEEQEPLRAMLARDLTAAGFEVDTLSSGNGFTEDMVRLIHPDLVLVDPFLRDVPIDDVERTLAALRAQLGFKLLVIDGGQDSARVDRLAKACGADGAISKKSLLAAPADAVAEQLLPEAAVVEDDGSLAPLPTADVAAKDGIEIELTLEPPQPRRPTRPPPSGPASRAAPRPPTARPDPMPKPMGRAIANPGILAMIDEELGVIPKAPERALDLFEAGINLFSRHNFYVGSTGDLATGGVFVATALLPRVGEKVRVRIEIPFAAALETEGAVEFLREGGGSSRVVPGAGISLAHLPEQTRRALEQFFRERAPLTHLPKR
ncbi:MAG: PleD family two-component system response regulator [Deltaproteobacteria bacterium]